MAFGKVPTTTTQGALAANQLPISSGQEPGQTDQTAIEMGPGSVDGNGNRTAPVSEYVKDGNDVSAGGMADAASTDATQTNKSRMAFVKGLVKIFADVWDSTNHLLHVNLKQVSGAPLSAANPVISEDNLQSFVRAGQVFTATTWRQTAGSTAGYGLSLFNPANSGKNVLLFSVRVYNSGTNTAGVINLTTTDPAYAQNCNSNTQLSNNKAGGPASALTGSVTYDITGAVNFGGTGVKFPRVFQTPQGQGELELLGESGKALVLPAGSANGVLVGLAVTSGNAWGVTISWAEY